MAGWSPTAASHHFCHNPRLPGYYLVNLLKWGACPRSPQTCPREPLVRNHPLGIWTLFCHRVGNLVRKRPCKTESQNLL